MQIASEEAAKEIIDPHFAKIKGCFERTFEKYTKFLAAFPETYYKRTVSILLQNWIVNEIKAQFSNMPGVEIMEKHESIQLVFESTLYARFKKLSIDGFPSNHKSTRNDRILGQLELDFGAQFERPTHINIGYVINEIWRNFAELKVTCIRNKQMIWDIPFTQIESENIIPNVTLENPTHEKDTAKPRIIINGEDHRKEANTAG